MIFGTDYHIWDKAPRHRVCDYASVSIAKLVNTLRIAESKSADLVLLGGDLFHRANAQVMLVNCVARHLAEFTQRTGIAVVTNMGSHDLLGKDYRSWLDGAVGTVHLCQGISVLIDVSDNHGSWVGDFLGKSSSIKLATIPEPKTDSDISTGLAAMAKRLNGEPALICLHHPVTTGSPVWTHIKPEALPFRSGQVVVSGHMHEASPISFTQEGAPVAVPGAAIRRNYDERHHVPQVVQIDIFPSEPPDLCYIPLAPIVSDWIEPDQKKTGLIARILGAKQQANSPDGAEDDDPPEAMVGREISAREVLAARLKSEPAILMDMANEILKEAEDE